MKSPYYISVLIIVVSVFTSFNSTRSSLLKTEVIEKVSLTTKQEAIKIPENYFGSPIDIPITLAGNFGEPRRLHFHTGLDIKTNQEEGHAVFAAADGYISRINVSGYGYGNALYIIHPNGFVAVYKF